jgi:hypothetical protein
MVEQGAFKPMSKKVAAKYSRKYGVEVQINRTKYGIVWCENVQLSGSFVAGLCDPQSKKLYIDPRYETEATLMHEIFHAELCEAGFRQRNDWDMNLEEQIVETLSQAIAHGFKIRKR